MALTFRSKAEAMANDAGSIGVSAPTGLQSGDLLLGFAGNKDGGAWSTPAGWTLISAGGETSFADFSVFYKIATGSEGTTTFSLLTGTSPALSACILAYSGADGANPVVASGMDSGDLEAPSVASTVDAQTVVAAAGCQLSNPNLLLAPLGYTERVNISPVDMMQSEFSLVVADKTVETAGPSGSAVFSDPMMGSSYQVAFQAAFLDSTGGGDEGSVVRAIAARETSGFSISGLASWE